MDHMFNKKSACAIGTLTYLALKSEKSTRLIQHFCLLFSQHGCKPKCSFLFLADQYALSLAFYLVGTACSGAMLSALYIYTAELYPTQYRHRFFAFSSMMGRFGSVFAPLTPALVSDLEVFVI